MSYDLLVTVALQRLGKRFDTLIAVITHAKVPPTLDALTALLVEEVARIGEAPIYKSVNTAETNRGALGVCYHCGKPGHRCDWCFKLHPELKNKEGGGG